MKEEASMDQLFLDKVLEAIEDNLANENFGVEELALEIGLSRSQLRRKLTALSGQSPSQLIKEFRLKKAMEMLQNKAATASEISYQVGFGSPSYFNTCFHEYFGYPPGKVKHIESSRITTKHSISPKQIITSSAALVLIALLIIFYSIVSKRNSETGEARIPDKSIAVLPFINDSQDQENEHLINGIMEEIVINLQSIKELRVPGRTSTEQYRDAPKPIPEIAREMNVAYILEGSGQRYGDKIRLRVQLVEGLTDKHLWADSYDEEINKPEDIFRIQSQIAKSIAAELQAAITPEEKQRIEKVPTTSLTAYDFYQRGMNEYYKYSLYVRNREALVMAEDLFHKALEYDSTYALAYTGLTYVYNRPQYWENMSLDNPYDTILILANIALSYDDQLSEAYNARGYYYYSNGLTIEAAEDYNKAIKFNPNDSEAYRRIAKLYENWDLVQAIAHLQKAASLYHPDLPSILRELGRVYSDAGFTEKTNYYLQEALKLGGDSLKYYRDLNTAEMDLGNYEEAIEFGRKGYAINPNASSFLSRLASCYLVLGQYEKSLKYYEKYIENRKARGRSLHSYNHWIGLAYWQNGYKEEAEYYINELINYCNQIIEKGSERSRQQLLAYYYLAEVYAFRGEKDKAYENLRIFNQRQTMPSRMVAWIKSDPFFESLRDEPEFQQIVKDIEAKYLKEHERVRQWLEENDML